jgi:hypothetical protein
MDAGGAADEEWQSRAEFWAARLGAELGASNPIGSSDDQKTTLTNPSNSEDEWPSLSHGDPSVGLSTSLRADAKHLKVWCEKERWRLKSKRREFQLDGAALALRGGECGEGDEEEVIILSEPGQAVAWSFVCSGPNFMAGVCPREKAELYLPSCFTHRTDVMWAMSGNNAMREGGQGCPGFEGLKTNVRYNFVLEFRAEAENPELGSFWCFWDSGEGSWSRFLVSDAVPLAWRPVPFAAADNSPVTLLAAVREGGGHLVKSARKS